MKKYLQLLVPISIFVLLWSQSVSAQSFTCWEGESSAEKFKFGGETLVICGKKIDIAQTGRSDYIINRILDENTGDVLLTTSGRNKCVIYKDENGLKVIEMIRLPAGPDWESWGLALWKQRIDLTEGSWKVGEKRFLFSMEEREDKVIEDFVNSEVRDFSGILPDDQSIPMMKKLLVAALRGNYFAEKALWNFETHFGRELDYSTKQYWKDYVSILHILRQ